MYRIFIILKVFLITIAMRKLTLLLAGIGMLMFLGWQPVQAFHPDVYTPRVPPEQLEAVQEIESPFDTTPERIAEGRKIFFGIGLCDLP